VYSCETGETIKHEITSLIEAGKTFLDDTSEINYNDPF
jgi:hypothetical protein